MHCKKPQSNVIMHPKLDYACKVLNLYLAIHFSMSATFLLLTGKYHMVDYGGHCHIPLQDRYMLPPCHPVIYLCRTDICSHPATLSYTFAGQRYAPTLPPCHMPLQDRDMPPPCHPVICLCRTEICPHPATLSYTFAGQRYAPTLPPCHMPLQDRYMLPPCHPVICLCRTEICPHPATLFGHSPHA